MRASRFLWKCKLLVAARSWNSLRRISAIISRLKSMTRYLDLSTEGNLKDGCMQDVHWFAGLFGYFPAYTLGALMAAQWFAAASAAIEDLDVQIAAGDFAPLIDWLRREIHGRGQLKSARELLMEVTGQALDLHHFRAHLDRRYLDT
jgi:carboxypeptidase Taq